MYSRQIFPGSSLRERLSLSVETMDSVSSVRQIDSFEGINRLTIKILRRFFLHMILLFLHYFHVPLSPWSFQFFFIIESDWISRRMISR